MVRALNGPMEDLFELGQIFIKRATDAERRQFLQIQEKFRLKWLATTTKLDHSMKQCEKLVLENSRLKRKLKQMIDKQKLEEQNAKNSENERLKTKTNELTVVNAFDQSADAEIRPKLKSPIKFHSVEYLDSALAGKRKRKLQKHYSDVDLNPIYEQVPSLEKSKCPLEITDIIEKPSEEISNDKLCEKVEQHIDHHECEHLFSRYIVSRPVVCFLCNEKIRFGIKVFKCKSCNNFVHHDCKSQMEKAKKNNENSRYYLHDYVTSHGPSVPELIIHCVNEVETRGLSEKGIYRVSGSEKEVQALKNRFLQNNDVPSLSNVDMHVICSCIKTFLRGLPEPLIPTSQWTRFSNFVIEFDVDSDDGNIMKNLQFAIEQLPKANRDTLAYLILHLQRVATCKAVQMPIQNLAKVFGPTVVGYSKSEPDIEAILGETIVQQQVMEHLLNIHPDYWFSFIDVE